MKKINKSHCSTIYLLLTLCLFIGKVQANQFGLGAMIGSYTALSAEYELSKSSSYDSGLAFNLGDKKKFHLHVAKLFHKPESLVFSGQTFGWYYGLGGRYRTFEKKDDDDDEYKLGARASIGLKYAFKDMSLKAFSEFAFTFNIVPETDADGDIVFGLRYYF